MSLPDTRSTARIRPTVVSLATDEQTSIRSRTRGRSVRSNVKNRQAVNVVKFKRFRVIVPSGLLNQKQQRAELRLPDSWS